MRSRPSLAIAIAAFSTLAGAKQSDTPPQPAIANAPAATRAALENVAIISTALQSILYVVDFGMNVCNKP